MEDTECLKVPGYDFWIESEGKRMKQYQVKETNESGHNVVSCYIASEVGKVGGFFLESLEENLILSASIWLYLNDDCVKKYIHGNWEVKEEFISHIYTAADERRKFAFTAIKFEEDEHSEFTTIPQNLGTIRAEIFRVVNLRYAHSGPPETATLNTPTLLSEKSKTVGCHTVSLLEPEAVTEKPQFQYVSCKFFDSKIPWYTIKFLYRPLADILQAEGIAPFSTPNPTPNGDVGRVNDLKAADLQEPIVIEDSDEDVEYFNRAKVKVEDVSSSKRSREPLDPQARKQKRIKKASDPVVIIVDSD
ncbi:hypothetical protein Clacol_006156 [Clathrus columnatus]|uniref:DUF7918 domain-containing protein n=1 Tax=Clathrus columnatus TaxID=1419009 RepID=A0AAV5AFL1_9AGAM|nr:hypothetical protein Clacol_006156 [Clathrus columnatus]